MATKKERVLSPWPPSLSKKCKQRHSNLKRKKRNYWMMMVSMLLKVIKLLRSLSRRPIKPQAWRKKRRCFKLSSRMLTRSRPILENCSRTPGRRGFKRSRLR